MVDRGNAPLLVLLDQELTREPTGPLPVALRRTFHDEHRSATVARRRSHGDSMLAILFAAARADPGPALVAHGAVIGYSGSGRAADLAAGLRWAAVLPSSVVAVPLGLVADHPTVRAAVVDLLDSGASVLAAVGNPASGQDRPLYPAGYDGVIAVGSARYAQTCASWDVSPDQVIADLPDEAVSAGTSGACIVAAWRAMRRLQVLPGT